MVSDSTEPSRMAEPGVQLTRLTLLVGLGYLLFATFQPFFSSLIWSAVLSFGLYPLYRRLLEKTGGRRSVSAAIMSVGVTVGLILPLVYISFLIGKELTATYLSVVETLQQDPGLLEQWRGIPWVSEVIVQIHEFQRMTGTDLRSVLVDNLADIGSTIVGKLTHVAGNVLAGLMQLGIISLSTFYFFRDGREAAEWIKELIPIAEERQHLLIRRFDEVVKGTVLGNTLVAALEGLVGGVAFWIVGVPSALLWGTVMAVLAYLPLVGATLVWGPVAAYLFAQGRYLSGTLLCLAGVVIAILDYVVRTIVVGEASKLHSLLTFFAVIGGIQLLGLVGIVAGPLIVAVSVTLLESYRMERSALILPDSDS